MKTITITVDVDGNSVSRTYDFETATQAENWGNEVSDMLDTLEKSNEKEF